jgi:hypothetical protein
MLLCVIDIMTMKKGRPKSLNSTKQASIL